MENDKSYKTTSQAKSKKENLVLGIVIVAIALIFSRCFFSKDNKKSQDEEFLNNPIPIELSNEELSSVQLSDEFHLVDKANIISLPHKMTLLAMLQKLEAETSTQIVVYTLNSLKGETIERKAVQLFEQMKIGQKGLDNGVLLLVSLNDRKMRIEVGYGLEGVLTDLRSDQIIRNILVPAFRSKRYAEGIIEAVSVMIPIVKEESFSPTNEATTSTLLENDALDEASQITTEESEKELAPPEGSVKRVLRKIKSFFINLLVFLFILIFFLIYPLASLFSLFTGRGGYLSGRRGSFSGRGGSRYSGRGGFSGGGGASGSW